MEIVSSAPGVTTPYSEEHVKLRKVSKCVKMMIFNSFTVYSAIYNKSKYLSFLHNMFRD